MYADGNVVPLDKVTWYGSGTHIPHVMEAYPREEWCTCAPRVEWRDLDARGGVGVGGEGKGSGEGEGTVWEYPPGGGEGGWVVDEVCGDWCLRWVGGWWGEVRGGGALMEGGGA